MAVAVVFRHKEVTVYPDDSKKPAQDEGLNRRAEISLDRVWPVDKSSGEYITDPDRLNLLRYEDRLARAAHRLQARSLSFEMPSNCIRLVQLKSRNIEIFSAYFFIFFLFLP